MSRLRVRVTRREFVTVSGLALTASCALPTSPEPSTELEPALTEAPATASAPMLDLVGLEVLRHRRHELAALEGIGGDVCERDCTGPAHDHEYGTRTTWR